MFRGLAPNVILAQVRNTAAWALEGPVDDPAHSWRRALARVHETPQGYDETGAYLSLLLAAHFTTVATFVPTDVDSHIRHHAWARCHDHDTLRAQVALLDATDAWNVKEISARVVDVRGAGRLSGHDGEWLSVRAGALGRALALGDEVTIDHLAARIDRELDRQCRAFEAVRDTKGRELDALRVIPTVAHNVGDLSRVVEEWPVRTPEALSLAKRYARLGHTDGTSGDARFTLPGRINKLVTAEENHRFLPLRAARPLRLARGLLLPFSPFLEDWGASVARSPLLAPDAEGAALGGLASVVTALVEGHLLAPSQQGYLRALRGVHLAHPGGLDALTGDVPARLRKSLKGGAVREALGVDAERFAARMVNRYRSALDAATRER